MAERRFMLANSLTRLSAFHEADTQKNKTTKADLYATAAQSAAVLRSGAEFRKNRMAAADMLTTDEAADLAGVTRVTALLHKTISLRQNDVQRNINASI